jgi:uncharacterized phage protein gp47/JayE
MAFIDTPTTAEINAAIIAQLEASLAQTIPLLPKAFNRVLAKALASVFILLYKYAGFIFLQMFVSTATIEEVEIFGQKISPLIEWGRLIGVGDPVAGTQAELNTEITVDVQGDTLASGTQLTSNINGFIYITKTAVALDAATKQVEVKAVNDPDDGGGVGTAGNLDPGDTLTFITPLSDVNRNTEVISQVVTAADAESTEAYRQRVIDRFQKQPRGGAKADYEFWGEPVAGIINVFPYTGANAGEVDVYSEATPASSGSPDGIPTQAQLDAVEDAINFDADGRATRRPVGAFVNSLPISRTGFDVTVLNLQVTDEAQVLADIEAALTVYFLERAPFIDGLTVPPRTDFIQRSSIIGIVDDFVTAKNGTFTTATFRITGTGVDLESYSLNEGEKSKLVTFAST